jgi:Na+/H+ antiporter NhaD/arsenite permease-like protein
METIEHFSDFLRKIGAPNFLAFGIVIILIWLLFSGFARGLKRRKKNKRSHEDDADK